MKHELYELRQMQSLALQGKIAMTRTRIKGWIKEFGEEGVYVSFSGGKDSTVLLHIIREEMGLKNIPAVFVDTGLEYPEIREFVGTFENVVWLKPKMNFKQVIEKYGYPFFSKDISRTVYQAKNDLRKINQNEPQPYDDLLSLAKAKDKWEMNLRVAILLGTFETYWSKKKKGLMPKDGEPSRARYPLTKYQFMLNAPFDISSMCCDVMKKAPMHQYAKETGRVPFTAQMASESKLRERQWLNYGCNGFDLKSPISNPMAFWLEQDVLEYIKKYNIPICSVYGDVIEDNEQTDNIDGQMRFDDLTPDLWDDDLVQPKLKTTGCHRTGCMFCGYGCQLEKDGDGRFEQMKETHPKQYEWIMKSWDEGGLGYKEVIDWINENGNMNIKY